MSGLEDSTRPTRIRLPALAAATKVWRDVFPSPEDVYQKGLKFMKEQWAK
jgi:hypothetical protein